MIISYKHLTCFMQRLINNLAFIDGQNLHLGTAEDGWQVDYYKLRRYLRDKYKVKEACYYFGYLNNEYSHIYKKISDADFYIVFKEHKEILRSNKKGNVDSDIIFDMMRSLIDKDFGRILLISGDGDYKKIVDYLISKNKFKKILFPNKRFASSLYINLGSEYFDNLGEIGLKNKLSYMKRAP